METERRAMILIRLIVEAYLQGGGGGDWRFCIQATSILTDIVKNNLTPGDAFHLTALSLPFNVKFLGK